MIAPYFLPLTTLEGHQVYRNAWLIADFYVPPNATETYVYLINDPNNPLQVRETPAQIALLLASAHAAAVVPQPQTQ